MNIQKFFRLLRPIVHPITDLRRVKIIENEIMKRVSFSEVNLENKVLIDLGANRGDFSYWGIKKGMRVFSFEPNKSVYKILLNRLKKFDNTNAYNLAIGRETSYKKLYLHKNSKDDPIGYSISSSLMDRKSNIDTNKFQETLVINFSDILNLFDAIFILKIDIEGAEIEIWHLIVANFKKIDYLFLEIHDEINPELRKDFNVFVKKNSLNSKWFGDWI